MKLNFQNFDACSSLGLARDQLSNYKHYHQTLWKETVLKYSFVTASQIKNDSSL